ncbi:hypothetical protein OAL34_02770 [Synechococcus sp. AH-551-G03]|nr:hypothetical protein [Synechococcus sp. AH-551-G03]
MNYNLQTGLLKELAKQADLNTKVEELAVRHGASSNAGLVNSVAFLERKLAELEEAEQKVRQLGYQSLNAAIYGLSKQNRYPNVPQDIHQVPNHWVTPRRVEKQCVWKSGKQVEKVHTVAAVTAQQARRKHNDLLPYLNKLLEGADAEFVNSVRENHRDPEVTFDEFAYNCHRNLAEDAGLGTTWDAEALPPKEETTAAKGLAPYTAEEEAALKASLSLEPAMDL